MPRNNNERDQRHGIGAFARMLLGGVALAATAAVALATGSAEAAIPCATAGGTPGNPTFALKTQTGYMSTPDGNSVYMWGFAPAGGAFQTPAPVLCVNQGDVVTVTLQNYLAEPVSIVFPGQDNVSAAGGQAGLFTREAQAFANPNPGTVTYTFIAAQPGTYLYESGTTPQKQVEMGLYGAIVVRPTAGAGFAYNDPSSAFDPAREYLLVMHEVDPYLHQDVERGVPFDATKRHPSYWTLNGRSFPDSILGNSVPWLDSQPYGSLVTVRASTCAITAPGCAPSELPALVRIVNAGLDNHPFHPHGNHTQTIGRDGRLIVAGLDSAEAFTQLIAAGQTQDLLAQFVIEQDYVDGTPAIPTTIPVLLNQVFKDGVTFHSGSPYLGQQGALPAPVVSLNECGEYYYPWHSHALNEFQNFNEGFGGLATLWRVEPPAGCP